MWDYNEKVMEHFLKPRNSGDMDDPDAVGEVGNMACGDALKLMLRIRDGRIEDARFKTFGCASAIASSSVLTEIIKGMPLEDAGKVTNNDIVEVLGSLPEEKMHCSVMGMEALQAAIADYEGREVFGEHEDHEGRIVCRCFGVTDTKIRKVARDNDLHTVGEITHYTKAGGACGTCLDQIQEILDGLWSGGGEEKVAAAGPSSKKLSMVQKVMKVQELIDKDIVPMLEKDGGSIELVDIQGDKVLVRLTGRCASCPTSHVTIKHTVEAKLREFVSPELTVEEIK